MHHQQQSEHSTFRLRRLNADVHNPCYLLHLNDVNVLLDCCIDTSVLTCFMPYHPLINPGCSDLPPLGKQTGSTGLVTIAGQTYLDARLQFCMMEEKQFKSVIWDTVDVILISNTRSVLGLPFVCTATNFRGRILATEPVIKFGKILMEDLADALEQVSSTKQDLSHLKFKSKSLPFNLDAILNEPKVWQSIYSKQTVMDTLNRIQFVAYHEPVDIFGLLTIRGSSAGFGIGSCNWTLASETEKVAYISHTSLLYSHVLPFDDSHFSDCDILIVGTMNMLASAQLEKVVGEFRTIVVQTLARGGHVLVPINPCGLLFDLLETAIHAKENFNGTLSNLFTTERSDSIATVDNGQSCPPSSSANSSNLPAQFEHSSADSTTGTLIGGSSLASRVARCPVYAVSSQIHASLAYANAYGEWLNPEKESLLYTADAPFPYQTLLRSGQLIAVRSLHDTPPVKDLGSNSSHSVSSGLTESASPVLIGGPNGCSGDTFAPLSQQAGGLFLSTTTTSGSDTGLALFHSSTRDRQVGLSGGIWPSLPCLIFASHPSLRFGPAVHLLRALAFGGLRPTGRTAQNTSAPRHAVVLVESSDYVQRLAFNENNTAAHYMRQLLAPYLPVTSDADPECTVFLSPTGIPCCNLTESVTVFWLPMEARIGPDEIPQLLTRCGAPRLAVCLPVEAAAVVPDRWNQLATFNVHVLSPGDSVTVPLHGRARLQPIRLSAQLVSHMRPVCVLNRNELGGVCGENATPVPGTKRPLPTVANMEPSGATKHAPTDSASLATDASNRTYVALVDGMLVSRDGKYWLNDVQESTIPGSGGRPVIRSLRPSTPPLMAPVEQHRSVPARSRSVKSEAERIGSTRDTRVFVSQTPRIDPHRLINQLTERGVTGAYLADPDTSALMKRRFATFGVQREVNQGSEKGENDEGDDFILFPNPNTAIRLSNDESHILAMDDSTRTAIRDTILSCLHMLDTCVKTSG